MAGTSFHFSSFCSVTERLNRPSREATFFLSPAPKSAAGAGALEPVGLGAPLSGWVADLEREKMIQAPAPLPWRDEDEEGNDEELVIWLVGGEDDDVDALSHAWGVAASSSAPSTGRVAGL